MNQPNVCLLKSFDRWESGDCLESESQSAHFNELVSCKIRGEKKKKIYICYVLYMVCIVFVKMNRAVFYRTTLLYEDIWKYGTDPKEEKKKKLDYIV